MIAPELPEVEILEHGLTLSRKSSIQQRCAVDELKPILLAQQSAQNIPTGSGDQAKPTGKLATEGCEITYFRFLTLFIKKCRGALGY